MSTIVISDDDFRALRDMIRDRLGLFYDDAKRYLLLSRLQTRLARRGIDGVPQYVRYLKNDAGRDAEWAELAQTLSNNETYFFRERAQLRALTGPVVDALQSAGGSRFLRVWSAACSTGEEPYSLAIALLESGKFAAGSMSIHATDFSARVLEIARRGYYRPLSFRATEPAMLKKWFVPSDRDGFEISPAIRKMVSFAELNLVDEATVKRQGPFDVIFCRNALIYFDRATQKRVVESFASALRPSGYLFLGHAESLFHLTDLYEPISHPEAIVYRLRSGARLP